MGAVGDAEAPAVQPGGQTGDAQDAYRVFAEGGRDMAQEAVGEVVLAVVGVYQLAVRGFGDGVDGEVSAAQVFFQGDFWRGVDVEAVVAVAVFALGAGEGVFVAAVRVQEYREVLADLFVALVEHLLRRCADYDPVELGGLQAQQFVAHCAADEVDLHGCLCSLAREGAFDRLFIPY